MTKIKINRQINNKIFLVDGMIREGCTNTRTPQFENPPQRSSEYRVNEYRNTNRLFRKS